MAWQKNYGEDSQRGDIAWDLRQGYAKLLMSTLEKIKQFRETRDYKNWYEELDGLYIDISMYLTSKDEEGKPICEQTEYQKMVGVMNTLIKDNPQAYQNEMVGSDKIYTQLKKMNMWLLSKMKEYDIFGSKMIDDDEY